MNPLPTARIVPTSELGGDEHQVALWRLSAVVQYLYDTMGDEDSDRPCPLPGLAAEKLYEAEAALHEAIKQGQRARRRCIGGELDLVESWRK